MLLYNIARIIFYVVNRSYFPDADLPILFLGGLKFDLPAVIYTNAVFIIMSILPFSFRYNQKYQNVIKWFVYIVNAITLAVNFADTIFFQFTNKRTTGSIFQEFSHESNGLTLMLRFIFVDYWYMTVLWVVLLFLFFKSYQLIQPYKKVYVHNKWMYFGKHFLIFALTGGLLAAGARGGFDGTTRPISLNNAGEYVQKPLEMAIVLNTPFSILRTLNKKGAKKKDYYSKEELATIYSAYHKANGEKAKKMNVVTIVIESFGREYISSLNQNPIDKTYQGYTPFTDSLIQHSKAFVNAYANGRKSIDGLPAVVSSIPYFYSHYVLSHYSTNAVNSMASVLKDEGYRTAFFHGAPNGSMGFDAFMNLAGYDEYYGKTEYNNDDDFDGVWGIWDEPFLQYFAETMNTFEEPFLTTLFTLSSHHPFKVPEQYKERFKGGPLALNKATEYTDYALQQFFKTASKMPWFENTLFVITADHTSQVYYPEYKTSTGIFKVPVIYYAPSDSTLVGIDSTVTQQIDIFPTVVDYVGVKDDYIAFGQNALDSTANHFAVNFYAPNIFQLVKGDYVIGFDGNNVKYFYNLKTDPLQEKDLKGQGIPEEKELERLVKGVIQEFSERVIDNKMTVEGS